MCTYAHVYTQALTWAVGTPHADDTGQYAYTYICKHTLYMYVYSIYISFICIFMHMYICTCIYTGADMGCGYTSR